MTAYPTNRMQADVIIVGGGFMGAATAFFLRRQGLSVILLERDLVGQAASGVNFGNVRRQSRYLGQLPLANRSRDIWLNMPRLIGEDAEFVMSGHILVTTSEKDGDRLEKYAVDCKPYGLDLTIMTGAQARAKFPMVGPEIRTVSYSPLDGHANPRLAAPAFGRAARRAGARVIENTEVCAITKSAEDFIVETRNGQSFQAPLLQISSGAWGRAMAASFGEDIPFAANGPQMGVTEPLPYRIEPVIGCASSVPEEGVYLRQVKRGNIVFGGGLRSVADIVTKRAPIDPLNTMRQMPHLARLVPQMARLRIIRTWSGVEGYVGDNLPIMGPSSRVPGLFFAFGFCGHGFQLGPGVGMTMAELIATGRTDIPLEPFHIKRFQ
ncbi:sarcosine oxidase subunit beta [Komagataeibacter nataicola]|uniref:Sarcosine oxidase subunit beta n=1 Tax=Komagataeibacter nataicola TaxID=265960 RepID=A0A9N7C917_9PROT|nr:FAD-binding oxidoreductase [Komagataeibacter nataicola]AQU87172.1 sarcosine oxidase subunit beta [Komagataeibacter nataicola]PYD65715.1 sarcosine oxidase subunit beta [Komagataeibacter nataicola]WEQ55949.1 FAD-binding oxidoreductase [Komagataeibacter nataicola]WNM07380.1 FAD-binding oxidoreductase [Komagataeibacter nataicola]GBR13441.1 glycine/D-amino acid oxidase [Komagataeibacter nataicola NRIC 0616]